MMATIHMMKKFATGKNPEAHSSRDTNAVVAALSGHPSQL
jgi:hypothetical protein